MPAKRLLTALIGLPLFVLLIFRGSPFVFFLAVLIVALLGQKEFYDLLGKDGEHLQKLLGLLMGALVLAGFYSRDFFLILGVLVVSFLLVVILRTFSTREVARAAKEVGLTFLGIMYVCFLLGYLLLIRWEEKGPAWIFFLFLVVWGGDTGAYFIGSRFGKHRLSRKLSPNKTLEGAAGGLLFSLAGAGIGWALLFSSQYTAAQITVLGAVLAATGQIGDLSESLFKRSSGAKDSGSVFPGHGGVLDRFDSILFACPILYYLMV